MGIIKVIFVNNWANQKDCDAASDVDVIREIAETTDLNYLSSICHVDVDQIYDIAKRFATVESSVCVAKTGVSQNCNSTLGEWLSHVLNLITDRIDRQGGRYYQAGMFKNSMKLVNSLAPKVKRRSRIGDFEAIAGAYPLSILPEDITTPAQDQIRTLIINSGNPVVSGPDGAVLDEALDQLDLLVAIDFFQRGSHRHADWIIPGCHFLEREELFAQLGQAVFSPPGEVKPEWQFFLDLALAMRVPFMGIPDINGLVRVSRWVARKTGNPHHAFNPRWIWASVVSLFGKVRWKELTKNKQGVVYGKQEYGKFRESLQTSDGKINAVPPKFVEILRARLAEDPARSDSGYVFSPPSINDAVV